MAASRAARIGWFVLIWAGGVFALGVVGSLIKMMLR
ncbi:DUF2474 family protein [Roseomonas sp. CAU 1739]